VQRDQWRKSQWRVVYYRARNCLIVPRLFRQLQSCQTCSICLRSDMYEVEYVFLALYWKYHCRTMLMSVVDHGTARDCKALHASRSIASACHMPLMPGRISHDVFMPNHVCHTTQILSPDLPFRSCQSAAGTKAQGTRYKDM